MLERIKEAYLLWHEYHSTLPKIHRHTLGARIDFLFIEAIEAMSAAAFLLKSEKLPYIRLTIRKTDALKLLLMVLWESHSLETKKYIALSQKMDGVGKMLGGWQGQVMKQNSPAKAGEK